VPAAAVIPAPIAYIKVAAVKKLVVGFLARCAWPAPLGCECRVASAILLDSASTPHGAGVSPSRSFTLKKLECFKQAYCYEYISME
jgi:hypothetical protein